MHHSHLPAGTLRLQYPGELWKLGCNSVGKEVTPQLCAPEEQHEEQEAAGTTAIDSRPAAAKSSSQPLSPTLSATS